MGEALQGEVVPMGEALRGEVVPMGEALQGEVVPRNQRRRPPPLLSGKALKGEPWADAEALTRNVRR